MSKINRFLENLLGIVPGGVFGLCSMSLGGSFIFISLFNYPNYSMIDYYISYLGYGPGLSGPFFNIGLIISGLLIIPFFIYLVKIFKIEGRNERFNKNTIRIAILACISLSLVGLFPAYNYFCLIIHGIFAALFFISSGIFCVAISYLMWKDPRFPKIQSYVGFILGGIFALYVATLQPIFEWICFFGIAGWVIETSAFCLYKKI